MYRVKLIGAGKVLNLNQSLDEQGIRNNQQIMAVLLNDTKVNAEENMIYDKVKKTKEDALLLMKSDSQHLQVN